MTLCLSKKESIQDLEISIFDTIKHIPVQHWNKVVRDKNIYLTLGYLKSIEHSLSFDMVFRYLVFYNAQKIPVSVAVVQFLPFMDKERKDEEQLCTIRRKIKNSFLASSGIQVMSCGSPFSCGENGFMYTEDISEGEAYCNLAKGLIALQKTEKNKNNAPVIVLKDFWPETIAPLSTMKRKGFKDFMIDVNMVMNIHSSWVTFDDYLLSMVTKFRTKAKSAFKKSTELKVLNFQVEHIIAHKLTIERLYKSVVDKSDFNFGALNGDAFVQLKENLHDQFNIQGYFLNQELVGFSSAFIFDDVVDANYVGIDYSVNHSYALYQRMLYDYVDLAIKVKAKELRLGRTAEEIKSTIGAIPVKMMLYIRHQSKIKNTILKPVFGSLTPRTFEQRNPFKADFKNS